MIVAWREEVEFRGGTTCSILITSSDCHVNRDYLYQKFSL